LSARHLQVTRVPEADFSGGGGFGKFRRSREFLSALKKANSYDYNNIYIVIKTDIFI
jgi:hypothetical protein